MAYKSSCSNLVYRSLLFNVNLRGHSCFPISSKLKFTSCATDFLDSAIFVCKQTFCSKTETLDFHTAVVFNDSEQLGTFLFRAPGEGGGVTGHWQGGIMRDHRVSKSTLNKYDTCEILPLTSIGKIWLPMQVKCLYQDPKQVKTLHSISLQNQTPKHVISNAKSIPLFSFCVFLTLYSRYVCIVPDLENDILFTCFLGHPWYPLVNDHCPPPGSEHSAYNEQGWQ